MTHGDVDGRRRVGWQRAFSGPDVATFAIGQLIVLYDDAFTPEARLHVESNSNRSS